MLERSNGERMALEALGGERVETIGTWTHASQMKALARLYCVRIQSRESFGLSLFASSINMLERANGERMAALAVKA